MGATGLCIVTIILWFILIRQGESALVITGVAIALGKAGVAGGLGVLAVSGAIDMAHTLSFVSTQFTHIVNFALSIGNKFTQLVSKFSNKYWEYDELYNNDLEKTGIKGTR